MSDPAERRIGTVIAGKWRVDSLLGRPRAWRLLHWTGAHFVWLSFIVTFGKRTGPHPAYWGFIAVLAVAMALRLLAWRVAARRSAVVAP